MPPDPLTGAYQVSFAHYASYIAQQLINYVDTMAVLFESSTLKFKLIDLFLLILCS